MLTPPDSRTSARERERLTRPRGIFVVPVLLGTLLVAAVVAVTAFARALPDPAIFVGVPSGSFTASTGAIVAGGWALAIVVIVTLVLARRGIAEVALGYAVEIGVPVIIAATLPVLVAQIGLPRALESYELLAGPTTAFIVTAVVSSTVIVIAQARGSLVRTADLSTRSVRTEVFPGSSDVTVRESRRDVTEITASGMEKYTSFMGRSLPGDEARLLAEQVLFHVRFHTSYLPYEPTPSRIQFALPSGAMFVMEDRVEQGLRVLDFLYAQGFTQFQSKIRLFRPTRDEQVSPWFSWAMTDREVEKVLLLISGVIDTTHNAAQARRDPHVPVVDPTQPPTRIDTSN